MKTTKREKPLDGGTDLKKDGNKGTVKRIVKEDYGRDTDVEEKRRRHEYDNYSNDVDSREHADRESVNENSRGGRKKGVDMSRELSPSKRMEHVRRGGVKVSRKAVSKRYDNDGPRRYAGRNDSPRIRKGRDNENYYNERHNRFGHHEEDNRGHYRNGLNGGGRHEESRRSPHPEDLAERNKRTVFIGNIPFSVKCTSHLLDILGVSESVVQEARIRQPKFLRFEQEGNRTDKNMSQKAYVTMRHEKDVKLLLDKDGMTYLGNALKVDMVIHSKHYDREKTVLVKSLSFSITEGQLFDMFSSFGRVKGYRLIRDRRTNKSLGYGFIYFENKESVEKAIRAMNGKRVQNRHLIVTAMEQDYDAGYRHPPTWNHPNGERRFYDYKARKTINKRNGSYRRK